MGIHSNTVFKNSCLKVPVNPTNRLPSAKYERNSSHQKSERSKKNIMSFSSSGAYENDLSQDGNNPLSFREFYKSIPDYADVTHMTNREFYMTLESLKENKNKLLRKYGGSGSSFKSINEDISNNVEKYISLGSNTPVIRNSDIGEKFDKIDKVYNSVGKLKLPIKKSCAFSDIDSPLSADNPGKIADSIQNKYSTSYGDPPNNASPLTDTVVNKSPKKDKRRAPTPRYFEESDLFNAGSSVLIDNTKHKDDTFVLDDTYFKKSYSLPSSPVKRKRFSANYRPALSPKSPKLILNNDVFQERETENKGSKATQEHGQFRANPVPIESRIPLYDKIMEDQELRRSISKLQSTAELQAQMKPFTFTERDERQNNLSRCYRLCKSNPQLSMSSPSGAKGNIKSFRAKPVPKNLFSNYVYDKMREDDFYRALNRRIRAEEMLKAASLPPSMAKRERSKVDDLISPILQNVPSNSNVKTSISSESSSRDSGKSKGKKGRRRSRGGSGKKKRESLEEEYEQLKKEFINEKSPRKTKMTVSNEEFTKKIYGTNSSSSSSGNQGRVHSASELPSVNRSNLAAILRMEATKKKLESEMMKLLEEERFQSEVKWRDSVLRRKPAWSTIKNNHSNDIAMRLQTRKEEERLRREMFLHEMELMYGRVHQQPLMFERVYPPRRRVQHSHSKQNIREKLLGGNMSNNSSLYEKESPSPSRSRKVSINATAETIGNDIEDILYQSSDDDDDKLSSDIPESIGN